MKKRIQQLILHLTKNCVRKFYKAIITLEKKLNIEKKRQYETLTPTYECDKDNVYSDALLEAIDNRDVCNIALTGLYGSGKSSIIKKFKKDNPQYNYLDISMACFSSNKEGKDKMESLELGILQQISYYVKYKSVPYSSIQRIHNHSKTKIILYSLCIFLWLLSLIFLFCQDTDATKLLNKLIPLNKNTFIQWSAVIFFIVGMLFFIYKFLKKLINVEIGKIKVKGSEIELSNKQDRSLLSKFLDEIIYAFEVNKFDVVVIEDLDRYDCVEIFSKLREINQIINKTKRVNYKISFIYAISDDLFKDKHDRTKFFDVIIPIIPIIDVNNSGDEMLNIIKQAQITKLSESFLLDISLYISDMRLLKNIFNEYRLYRNKLNDSLDQEKLFALIVYKNFMPGDYKYLYIGDKEGIVYSIFKNIEETIKDEAKSIDNEIDIINEQISFIDNSITENVIELRSLYVFEIIKEIENCISIKIDDKDISYKNAISDEIHFNKLKNGDNISYYYQESGYSNKLVSPSNLKFNSIKIKDKTYDESVKILEIKYNNKKTSLNNKISEFKSNKIELHNKLLVDLKIASTSDFFSELNGYPIVTYMLRNGYINEDYSRYMSLMKEGGRFTPEDHTFLLSVKDGVKIERDFKINNINNILNQLNSSDYNTEAILNVFILDYLFDGIKNYKTKIQKIISLIKNYPESTIDFIPIYIKKGKHVKIFLEKLCEEWNNIWIDIQQDTNLTNQEIYNLIYSYIENVSVIKLKQTNIDGLLVSLIIENNNFFEEVQEKGINGKTKELLKQLEVKFIQLQASKNQELEDYVYLNNLYTINKNNITFFVNKYLDDTNPSLSNISKIENVYKYIFNEKSNLDKYISEIFLPSEDNGETEDNIILLLNNNTIALNNRFEIIKQKDFKITDIKKVENVQIIEYLIRENKCTPSWNNVINYFIEENTINETLLSYLQIEDNYIELSKHKCNVIGFEKETIKNINVALIIEKRLSINAYALIMKSGVYKYNDINISSLSDDKIKILIDLGILNFTIKIFNIIRGRKKIITDFIKTKKQDFFKQFNELDLDNNLLINIFESKIFSYLEKQKIISFIDFNTIETKGLANCISEVLIKKQIYITIEQLNKLLEYLNGEKDKVILINIYIEKNDIKNEEMKNFLDLLGGQFAQINKGKNVLLDSSDHNKKFINQLEIMNYISSKKPEGKGIRIFTKRS